MSAITLDLKRRLELDQEPLAKRIKLAENALCHPFVRIPNREATALQWICEKLKSTNKASETKNLLLSLKYCTNAIHFAILPTDTITGISQALLAVLKNEHLQNVSSAKISLDPTLLDCCPVYIEKCFDHNSFQVIVDEFLNFLNGLLNAILLKNDFKNEEKEKFTKNMTHNPSIKRILNTLLSCLKNYKKKMILIRPFIESNLLWTLMKLSENNYLSSTSLNICQLIIFPSSRSSWFKKYCSALIEGSASKMMEENGEVVMPIASVIDGILVSPVSINLSCILKLLMHSYGSDESIILLFILILYKYLGVDQDYIKIAGNLKSLKIDMKLVKELHLANLKNLAKFNVNLNAKHTFSTEGMTEKCLMELIQQLTVTLIKENTDMITIYIIREAFLLDPEILKPSMEVFMPDLILCKKDGFYDAYVETMVTIVNVIFKMSKGLELLPSLLLSLKNNLDEKIVLNNEKITSNDIFPEKFCDQFGKHSSELVPWQHIKMLKLLIEQLVELSSAGFKNSSDALLFEAVSSIIIAFHRHSKIADQSMPETIFVEFNETYNIIETKLLHNIGQIILKEPNGHQLLGSFLDMCETYGHQKLLLWRYQPFYEAVPLENTVDENSHISNIGFLHCYLIQDTWKQIYKLATKDKNLEIVNRMNILILQNHIAIKSFKVKSEYECLNNNISIKFRKNMLNYLNLPFLLQHDRYLCALLDDLTTSDAKILSEHLLMQLLDTKKNIFKGFVVILNTNSLRNQQILISYLVMQCIRKIWCEFENKKKLNDYPSLYKCSDDENFNLKSFFENVTNLEGFISKLIKCDIFCSAEIVLNINKLFLLLNELSLHYLNENIQYCIIFTIIVLYTSIHNSDYSEHKDILESTQCSMKSIFIKLYDVTTKIPNLFEVIPVVNFTSFIKTKFFRLSDNANGDSFGIIKHMILAVVNKNTMNRLQELSECLAINAALKGDECNNSLEIFNNEIFQFASFLLVTLNGVKRCNLTSEMKTILTKSQEITSEVFISYINFIKWKSISIESRLDNTALGNILEPHSIIFKQHLPKTENEPMKKFSKATDLFVELSFRILSGGKKNLLHARGSCNFINTILKNYNSIKKTSLIEERTSFLKNVWNANKSFLSDDRSSSNSEWLEIAAAISENTILACELGDVKFFNAFLSKELVDVEKFTTRSIGDDGLSKKRTPNAMRTMWRCFLRANLKRADKNDVRTSFVRRMIKKIFLRLRNRRRLPKSDFNEDDPDEESTIAESDENDVGALEIIVEFVQTKKMILSHSLIDCILQMPLEVDLDATLSTDAFCATFERCARLLSSILTSRYELLQDRWPCYFLSYRRLLGALCARSDVGKERDEVEIEKLVKPAIALERITQLSVERAKRDVSRTAAYLIGDVVSHLRSVSAHPSVKFHVQNCANYLFEAADEHSAGFLARNVSGGDRIIFRRMHDEYNKYRKFVGAS